MIFVFTRAVEACCFNFICYAFTVIPLNLLVFGEGVVVIVFARPCVHETIVPFIIVYAVLSIQTLIFLVAYGCMCFNWRNIRDLDIRDFDDDADQRLIEDDQALDPDTIDSLDEVRIDQNTHHETCTICLEDYRL